MDIRVGMERSWKEEVGHGPARSRRAVDATARLDPLDGSGLRQHELTDLGHQPMLTVMDTPTTTTTPDVARVPDPRTEPGDALATAVALRGLADRLEDLAVATAIDRGWTWKRVGEALGVSAQAVHRKHARRLRRSD